MLAAIGCKREFTRKHDHFPGTCPAPGSTRSRIATSAKCGTLLDKDRKVLWAMISSPLLMWFLAR